MHVLRDSGVHVVMDALKLPLFAMLWRVHTTPPHYLHTFCASENFAEVYGGALHGIQLLPSVGAGICHSRVDKASALNVQDETLRAQGCSFVK